jgi:hypothetical protein
MNDEDFLELRHNLERHENAITEDAKEIAAFVPRPVSGMAEEKAAIEFETQLRATLQKHGIER